MMAIRMTMIIDTITITIMNEDACRHPEQMESLMSAVDLLESRYCLEVQRHRLLIERIRTARSTDPSQDPPVSLQFPEPANSAGAPDFVIRPAVGSSRRAA